MIFIEKIPINERVYVKNEINSICSDLGIKNPDWLSIIIYRESVWNPKAKAKTSTATGLIQFLEATAKNLGTSTAKLSTMTISQQLPFVREYFKRMIRQYGKPKSLYQAYLLVHYPASSKKGFTDKIYSSPSLAYSANKALDKAKKGYVSGQDIENFLTNNLPGTYDPNRTVNTQILGIDKNYILYGALFIVLATFLYNPSYWLSQITTIFKNIKLFFTRKRFA
jgi:hypothetical protein